MSIIFISNIVPDKEEYWNDAFTRSGNNVFYGIVNSFPNNIRVELWSCRPTPSYPHGPLFLKSHKDTLDNGRVIHFVPSLNIKFVKNVMWGVNCFFKIIWWRLSHLWEECTLLTYNNDPPPIEALYFACRLCNIKIYGMLYDLGVPPVTLKLSKATRIAYHYMDRTARFVIKRLDGRIIINELIARDYAPGKDFLLIDGGISQDVINHLFPLEKSKSDIFTFVLAGMLWEQNGTKLILEVLEKHADLPVKVIFAGKGQDVELIKRKASGDSRIQYVGMLNMDELFSLYEQADVLLNLRIEEATDYHFPSKLLEYLVTGKYVISTPVAHAERDYGQFLDILHETSSEYLYQRICDINSMSKQELLEKGKIQRDWMLKNRTWSSRTKEMLNYMKIN